MIKKAITFEDFDGKTVTEDHYFHLSKSELIAMELSEEGGMAAKLEGIVKGNNGAHIINTFNEIIRASYGQRDPVNASKFFKSTKIRDEFMSSLAFDALFQELMTDAQAAANFVNGLVPKDLADSDAVQRAFAEVGLTPEGRQLVPPSGTPSSSFEEDEVSGLKMPRTENGELLPWAFREPTSKELTSMTREQMQDAFVRKGSGWTPPV
jgi:hypothetical protein